MKQSGLQDALESTAKEFAERYQEVTGNPVTALDTSNILVQLLSYVSLEKFINTEYNPDVKEIQRLMFNSFASVMRAKDNDFLNKYYPLPENPTTEDQTNREFTLHLINMEIADLQHEFALDIEDQEKVSKFTNFISDRSFIMHKIFDRELNNETTENEASFIFNLLDKEGKKEFFNAMSDVEKKDFLKLINQEYLTKIAQAKAGLSARSPMEMMHIDEDFKFLLKRGMRKHPEFFQKLLDKYQLSLDRNAIEQFAHFANLNRGNLEKGDLVFRKILQVLRALDEYAPPDKKLAERISKFYSQFGKTISQALTLSESRYAKKELDSIKELDGIRDQIALEATGEHTRASLQKEREKRRSTTAELIGGKLQSLPIRATQFVAASAAKLNNTDGNEDLSASSPAAIPSSQTSSSDRTVVSENENLAESSPSVLKTPQTGSADGTVVSSEEDPKDKTDEQHSHSLGK